MNAPVTHHAALRVGLDAVEILNCEPGDATLHAWKPHFAPRVQPFFARERLSLPASIGARWLERSEAPTSYNLSQHDTFATYEVSSTARHVLLLDEHAFNALELDLRAELLKEQSAVNRGSLHSVEAYARHLKPSE